jgi:two-component system, chemotaxis family, chemotaxis protein CheY
MANILVVDDSKFMRRIIMDALQGHNFIEASSGSEGIAKFKENKFDLILMDIIMESNGLEALKFIMNSDKNAKVIMVSAVGQDAMVGEAIKTGAKDFIVKPFNKDVLKEKVDKVLGTSSS